MKRLIYICPYFIMQDLIKSFYSIRSSDLGRYLVPMSDLPDNLFDKIICEVITKNTGDK